MGQNRNGGEERPARVLVADADPLTRQLVRAVCDRRPGLEFVGEAPDGPRALEEARRLAPDVVVLDVALPRLDGLAVARRLRETTGPSRVLVLATRTRAGSVLEAMRAGVEGYVEKSASLEEVATAIEAVAAGGRAFSEEQERGAVAALGEVAERARETASWLDRLSPRERDVLTCLAEGLSARQMSERLLVSERTIRSHLAGLYGKLGVKNRVAALSRAAQLGLIDLGSPGGAAAERDLGD